MRRLLLTLLWTAMVCGAWASPMPETTAAHFCQLMVQDVEGHLKSLGAFANGDATLFAEYVFQHDGWRDLRIFPHDGYWYAASDRLPADLDPEHQRYIQEVFPRMLKEVEAGRWQVVDQYIDRMLDYQHAYSSTLTAKATSTSMPWLIALSFVCFLLTGFVRARPWHTGCRRSILSQFG